MSIASRALFQKKSSMKTHELFCATSKKRRTTCVANVTSSCACVKGSRVRTFALRSQEQQNANPLKKSGDIFLSLSKFLFTLKGAAFPIGSVITFWKILNKRAWNTNPATINRCQCKVEHFRVRNPSDMQQFVSISSTQVTVELFCRLQAFHKRFPLVTDGSSSALWCSREPLHSGCATRHISVQINPWALRR